MTHRPIPPNCCSGCFCFSEEEDEEVDDEPTFSFQRREVNNAPTAKTTIDSSNGPVGPPRFEAASAASCPAEIATIESPAYA